MEPVRLAVHAIHAPVQAAEQHTPSTQKLLEHWLLAAHAAPLLFLATHAPLEQYVPPAQSESTAHEVLHAVAPQTYGVQAEVTPVPQVPAPLQYAAVVCEPLVQAASLQTVVLPHLAHPPVPHMPVVPQVDAAWAVHSLSGSVPDVMARHLPLVPPVLALEHATQLAPQLESQQTPSTQKPLVHSAASPHGAPSADLATHLPPEHHAVDTQSAADAQLVLQAVVPQTYGEHEVVAPPPQVPVDVQVPSAVCTPDAQDPATQMVPVGCLWHPPLPSQKPLVPHVDAACATHSLSGSVPAPTAPQTPSLPPPLRAAVHATHRPVHAALQHTPSTQLPDAHALAVAHAAPLAALATQVHAEQ